MTTEERLDKMEWELFETRVSLSAAKHHARLYRSVMGLLAVGLGVIWMWAKTATIAQKQEDPGDRK